MDITGIHRMPATVNATVTALPTRIFWTSEAAALIQRVYMSIVNIVEPLLKTEAMEDMSAASTAAHMMPMRGEGMTERTRAGKAVLGSDRTVSIMTLMMSDV